MVTVLRRGAPAATAPAAAPDAAEAETAAQLRDLERQGSGLAHLAHFAAGALIILFSLGSLISLSADALRAVLASWAAGGLDVPAAISLAVSTLLVVAMDTAMLYAAAVLRVLATRNATRGERWVHLAVMICACVLEAATYSYMSWMYDRPDNLAAWAITIARALSAPVFSVYLSMARPLPVGPRDIFAAVSLAAGKGVLHDVTRLANDRTAPLRRKFAIMGASADMLERDRAKLAGLIDAVSEGEPQLAAGAAGPDGRGPGGLPAPQDPEELPDRAGEELLEGTSGQVARRGSGRTANRGPLRVVTAPRAAVKRTGQSGSRRRDTGRSAEESATIRERRLALAAQLLEREPRMGAQRLAAALDCPKSVAGGIKREWLAERRGVASGAASRTDSQPDSRTEQSA